MKKYAIAAGLAAMVSSAPLAALDKVIVTRGLSTPESVVVGFRGKIFVSQIGEFDKDGDGSVAIVDPKGKVEIFAKGLDDPKGLAFRGHFLYAADKQRIWRIDSKGKSEVFVAPEAFPITPKFLNDLAFDTRGNLYVSDSGDLEGHDGAIFKVTAKGTVSTVVTGKESQLVKSPNGLLVDGSSLLVADFASGEIYRVGLKMLTVEKVAAGFGGADGLARDKTGHYYVSDWKNGRVWKLDLKSTPPVPRIYDLTFTSAADIALDGAQDYVMVPDMKAGTLSWVPVRLVDF